MNTLTWGILGTGRVTRKVIPLLQGALPHQSLLAVASRDTQRARAFADEWHIGKSYGTYEALLRDPDINAVYIALPNALHAEFVLKAIQCGKHVLCEKPLATIVDDVARIIEAAEQHDVVVTEGLMYRYHPKTHRVKALIRDRVFGAPKIVRGTFSFSITNPEDPRLNSALGGGALWDVGCYLVDFITSLIGEDPSEVRGSAIQSVTGVDTSFVGLLQFQDCLAHFDCSFQGPRNNHCDIMCERGTIAIPQPFKPDLNPRIELYSDNGVDIVTVEGENPFQLELEAFYDAACNGQRAAVLSLQESLRNIRVLTALQTSAVGVAAVV